MIKQWARIKGIDIIEGRAMPDHVHLCFSIPPKYSVARAVGLLNGKGASEVMRGASAAHTCSIS